mgnify:CR=1 FL=1
MTNTIIVFDIDGTLAAIEHRRHYVASKPKNWAAFNAGMANDGVHQDIVFLLKTFHKLGHTIILCSGRGEESREVTELWLAANDIPFHKLYMRPLKDYRADNFIKVDLLAEIRAEFGEPYLWFDDRNQVVDAIRAEGVRVLQVAPGDF